MTPSASADSQAPFSNTVLNVLCQVFETNTELLLLMLLKVSLFLYTHFILVKQTYREFSLFPCSTCSVFFYIEKMQKDIQCALLCLWVAILTLVLDLKNVLCIA